MNQHELLNTQNGANEISSNKEESFKHISEPIEDTPFRLVGNERDGFILLLGKHRLTDPVDTPEKCVQLLYNKQWQIIFHMIATMLEINEELRKTTLEDSEITE